MLRVVTCLILLAVLAPRATLLLAPGPRELIADPHFRGGFRLIDPTPGQRKVYGVLPALSPNVSVQAPSWDFDQWSSRFPLTVGTPVVLASGLRGWTNQGKSLCLGSGGPAQPDLSIAILATTEYRGRARKSGEPWVHGLVEQTFDNPPSLAALTSARIYLQARLTRSELQRTEDYSQGLHAAQFQLFLMLQNRRRDSPGYGKLVWFGIPLYDDRSRFAREHKQQDTGGTEMFIFTPAGDLFCCLLYTSPSPRD